MKYILLLLCSSSFLHAQPNCNYFKSIGDLNKYEACKIATNFEYYQFDLRQIEIWEKAIKADSTFAFPYYEISAPIVKSGNFISWKKYIDKAVKYDREAYLPVRASLKYKFFADYKGTIQDLDSLSQMRKDAGYTHNGIYHLDMIKALAYKHLGNTSKAIEIILNYISSDYYDDGLYDFIHLGVMYMKLKQWQNAINAFKRQEKLNDLAENRYYLAETYKITGQTIKYKIELEKAIALFENKYVMHDPYHILDDQIFLEDLIQ